MPSSDQRLTPAAVEGYNYCNCGGLEEHARRWPECLGTQLNGAEAVPEHLLSFIHRSKEG